jgi:polysaccharide export outer membrane protein
MPGDQTVQADGTIDLGPCGRLQVFGQTLDQIEAAAQKRITAYIQASAPVAERSDRKPEADRIRVRLVEPASKRYYVTGEVNGPGSYQLVGHETVLDAIIEAGGLTDRANRHGIVLSRPTAPCGQPDVLPICYRHIVQLGDTSTNYQIQPGDRIFVSSLTFWQELGQTLCPGAGETCPQCSGPHASCMMP